ncbi:MAG: glycoside hydrolase family 76 protein [Chloroflexi bacterium]|nr:glycoside hydrolase family 76 protein [Chloroflexota bacterium]
MGADTFKLVSGSTALQGALDVYQFLSASWHTSPPYPAYPKPGGVFWMRSDFDRRPDRDRGAGATGGFAKLAVHLYDLTNGPAYLDKAAQAYDWTRTYLYRTDDVYADKILPDGSIDWGVWSYNQGVMIGAGALLSRATGKAIYLQQATTTADSSIAYFNRYGWYNQPVILTRCCSATSCFCAGCSGPTIRGTSRTSGRRRRSPKTSGTTRKFTTCRSI